MAWFPGRCSLSCGGYSSDCDLQPKRGQVGLVSRTPACSRVGEGAPTPGLVPPTGAPAPTHLGSDPLPRGPALRGARALRLGAGGALRGSGGVCLCGALCGLLCLKLGEWWGVDSVGLQGPGLCVRMASLWPGCLPCSPPERDCWWRHTPCEQPGPACGQPLFQRKTQPPHGPHWALVTALKVGAGRRS